jgi:hypothetical protein
MPFCTKCGAPIASAAPSCNTCGAARTNTLRAPAPVISRAAATPHARGADVCQNCGRSFGSGRSCQFCKQVEGLPTGITIASPARRLGGYLLEGLLLVVTLVIGWIIWALVVFDRGQSPAKQLLGMRVVNLSTGSPAGFGRMVLREIIAKPVIGLLGSVAIVGIVANLWLVWDKDTQELWDKIVDTLVVNDPVGVIS